MDCLQLKMFAVASAVQDVSQLPMSGFQFALFLFLLGWKAVDQGQMSKRRQLLFFVCRQLLFYFYADSRPETEKSFILCLFDLCRKP